jgi:prevent-host-death family protein
VPKSYSIADARARLSEVLDEVQGGDVVELTRRGQAAAVLLSAERYRELQRSRVHFRDAYRAFVKTHPPRTIGLDAKAVRALRDRSPGRPVRS